MKRTRSPENRPLIGQSIKIEEVPPPTSISNTENPPRMFQREPAQISGLGVGIVGNPQPALNLSVNQLLFTNPRVNSPARFEQAPPLNSIPNAGNPPLMLQREPAQIIGFANGMVGQSQPVTNPSVNQLESTNVRVNSLPIGPIINTVDQPRLTQQMFPAAIAAISSGDLETAMQIVGAKSIEELAYSTDVYGYTLLAYAAEHGRAKPIRVLLSKVLDPQQLMQKKNNGGFTPIMIAAAFGHANVITAILNGVSNPQQLAEQVNTHACTALHHAAMKGHAAAITAILKDKSYAQQLAEQIDAQGASALHLAAENGHETVVTAILSNVPNPQKLAEQKNKYDYPPLLLAVLYARKTVVTAILSNVGNPQQLAEQSLDDRTVLMYAVNSEASILITKILESVEDAEKLIFQESDDGWNSFTYALKKRNMEAAELLFDKAKDKASLLLKTDSPNQPAPIKMMKPEIQDVFLKKYNEPNH